MKKRTTAILRALFLGAFGAHQFYLERPGQGMLRLLFFRTFIPTIIACIDIVRYLLKSNEEFSRIYS